MKCALFGTKEQGANDKINEHDEGAGSNQMIILEQGAQQILKSSMEQKKIKKRSIDPGNNQGAGRKTKRSKEHGKMKKERGKKLKRGQKY